MSESEKGQLIHCGVKEAMNFWRRDAIEVRNDALLVSANDSSLNVGGG